MELERKVSADENCHHDANIGAPPSQGSKAPKVIVASPAAFIQQEWTAVTASRVSHLFCAVCDGLKWGTNACSTVQHVGPVPTEAMYAEDVVYQSIQSDGAALSPGTQALLDVLHSSRAAMCLQDAGVLSLAGPWVPMS